MAEMIPENSGPALPQPHLWPSVRTFANADLNAMPLEDKELFIRKVFEQDSKKGCELLFRKYYAPLCSHAVRLVYAKQVAEDLVAEVFFTFWQKELHKQIKVSYRAYLFTAVRHRALTYLRWEFARENNTVDIADLCPASPLPGPDQSLHYEELSLKVERAIQSMVPQSQRIFIMSRFEGKQNRAIAEELQISVKTVESHITKALSLMRKVLRSEWLLLPLVHWLPQVFFG